MRRAAVALVAAAAIAIPLAVVAVPAPARAVTDETPSFVLNQNDLEFILRQIQISEAHAADEADPSNYTLLCSSAQDVTGSCVPDVARPAGLRTVDGTYNNLRVGQSEFGSADGAFPRLLDPVWLQGESAPSQAAPPNFGGNPPGSAPGPHAICQPGVPGAGMDPWGPTCYAQTEGFVYDSEPRVISNLIVDQTTSNPAILNQIDEGAATLIPGTDGMVSTPNTAPDEGLSAPFNTFLGFFGQFFDHGLDLVDKGGHGTLVVPLEEDDPLYDPTSNTNFLVLTRADRIEDEAGNATTEHRNLTSPFVDQNQTYSSHPSHQVFLREYAQGGGATGRLIEGAAGGMATWAEVKAQTRDILGIGLTDADLLDVPQVLVDPYGNFVPGPERGLPQLIVSTGPNVEDIAFVEGDPASPIPTGDALATGRAFLDDIAHGATPLFDAEGNLVPLQFDEAGNAIDPGIPLFDADGAPVSDPGLTGYDEAALGAHYIAGDGRVNENIGLTAVHAIFHSEHNRMVGQIEALLNGEAGTELLRNDATMADPTLLAEFAAAFRGEEHSYPSVIPEQTLPGPQADDWSYEQRLFQAAKFATEMQYQHIVFEEFARTIAPTIDAVVFNENSYDASIDASITAEFAHVVYRFGHSMMTEEIGREDVATTDGLQDVPLLDGFLNPNLYDMDGALTPDEAAGSLINGMTGRVGSQIDEHVTDTLRNNLLGLPLDLATINLLRGRDVGIPPLQDARATFFAATGDSALEPYADWVDFGLGLRNGNNFGRGGSNASLVNFVAAYGTHPSVTEATTLEGRRAAAQLLVNGAPAGEEFISRFPGTDRFHTAALFSQRHFPAGADTVYVTNGYNFPDALAAGALGGPILLVAGNDRTGGIPASTHAELLRLAPSRIVVLGDANAVSTNTIISLNALSATDAPVTRLAGANRYATAAEISAEFTAPVDRVLIANGQNFPDALAGAAVAAHTDSPVLLVTPTSIPEVIAAELERLAPAEIVILGGTPSVSASVASQLGAYTDGSVTRLAGGNRYETAIRISEAFYPDGADRVYVTTGTNFPDALAAAPGAGRGGSPVLLLPPGGLTPSLRAELTRLSPAEIFILGDTRAISAATELELAEFAPNPVEAPGDRLDFMNSTGAWADVDGSTVTGLESVEFWVGGLAERIDAFGGMLGSSFNYVFETQLEQLQFGDRFYYLFRNQGEQLFAALEGNSLSDLIQRNSDASHLPANIFALQDPIIDLGALPDPLPEGLLQGPDGSWRWSGDEHTEIHGTEERDHIIGDEGDDALWGYGGDDRIEGGSGNDALIGGPGHDIITDSFGDDTIHGDQGNDAIHVGPGADLALGGLGDDFVMNGGGDGSTFFLGMGDDIIRGTSGRMTVFGGEQHDWIEGSSHADLLQGDNADQFQNDTLGGNDVVIGGFGNDDIEGEGGDDVLVGAAVGTDRHLGNIGFDWMTFYGQTADVTADFSFTRTFEPNNPLPSRYDQLEALSGGSGADTLRGPIKQPDDIAPSEVPLHRATQESLDLVEGLEDLLRPAGAAFDYAAPFMRDTPELDADGVSMIIVGGPGGDTIEGRGGNDFLDGDAQLVVQLLDTTSGARYDSAADLQAAVFAGTVNPGDIDIVRSIVMDPDADQVDDTSVYANPMAAYEITALPDGYWQITHTQVQEAEESDGTDVIRGFERLQFSDGCAVLNEAGDAWEACEPLAAVSLSTDAPVEDVPVVATLVDADGVSPFDASALTDVEFIWWAGEGDSPAEVTEWEELTRTGVAPGSGATATASWTPDDASANSFLRVTVNFTDSAGLRHAATSPVTTSAVLNVNDVPTGLSIGYSGAPAAPGVGQLLTASSVSDGDGLEDVVFTYTWTRSADPAVPEGSEVLGSTSNTYTTAAADAGQYIRLTVTYTDVLGTAETVTTVLPEAVAAP